MTAEEMEKKNAQVWTEWIEKYSRRLAAEAKDHSDLQGLQEQRVQLMNSHNPRYVVAVLILSRTVLIGFTLFARTISQPSNKQCAKPIFGVKPDYCDKGVMQMTGKRLVCLNSEIKTAGTLSVTFACSYFLYRYHFEPQCYTCLVICRAPPINCTNWLSVGAGREYAYEFCQ